MEKEKLDIFKDLLTERKSTLLNEAKETMFGMTDDEEAFPDPNDRATQESDRNRMLRIRDRERKLISKIDKTLESIEDGTFGICEECGEEITEGRLKARPVTTFCIDCKEEQEKLEKARQG